MWCKLKFIYSKIIVFLQIASVRECIIEKQTWIGERSNLIRVKVGKYSYVGRNCNVVNTEIGAYCSIGSNCAIGGGKHPISYFSTSPVFYDNSNAFNIKKLICEQYSDYDSEPQTIIGNDVWIGEKVFIKAGVKIGNGVIIGAHSVVTKDVPDYAIVAGVPFRILRYRFNEDVIKEISKYEWWNMSEVDLKKNIPELINLTKSNE